jgi:hypothetical protein
MSEHHQHADILGILNVTREEIFASSANSVILISRGEREPCGEVYFRNDHFGVRFGDYNYSPIQKVLQ